MNKGLPIPVFFMTENQDAQESMGVDIDVSESEVKKVVFYEISAITKYSEHGKFDFSSIYNAAGIFISPVPIQQLCKSIKENWGI